MERKHKFKIGELVVCLTAVADCTLYNKKLEELNSSKHPVKLPSVFMVQNYITYEDDKDSTLFGYNVTGGDSYGLNSVRTVFETELTSYADYLKGLK